MSPAPIASRRKSSAAQRPGSTARSPPPTSAPIRPTARPSQCVDAAAGDRPDLRVEARRAIRPQAMPKFVSDGGTIVQS